jgi:hypothetical protein
VHRSERILLAPQQNGAPAVEAAGIPEPARIYDLTSTFASNALAANITVFELAKIMRPRCA